MDTLSLAVLVGLFAAVAATFPALRRRDTAAAMLSASRVLLVGALLAVLAVTTMNGAGGTGVNLTPGSGIRSALSNVNRDLGLLNLVGNVVMFAPVGFLLPLATRLGIRGVVAICASLSVTVELLQLMLGRSLDIDDVLLNTLGGAFGAAVGVTVAAWLRRRSSHPRSTTKRGVARKR